MAWLLKLLPQGPVVWPFVSILLMNGGRYFLSALVMFMLARAKKGRPSHPQSAPPSPPQLRHEILHSSLSIMVFGVMNSVLIGYGLIAYSRLYWHIDLHGWVWFWISIPLMLLIHDTYFYWLHRLLHSRLLFRRLHIVHHRSIYPSAWAMYSFHPAEALPEGLIAISLLFMMPIHPIAFVIYQTTATFLNGYGHCGREFLPPTWESHWLGRWINTSRLHSEHHASVRGNYGLYFLFWDRSMGTLITEER